jgi:hypothetical protein
VFGELYGSAIETRFARDVQEVSAWIPGGEEPATMHDASSRAERLDTMISRLSAAHKGVRVLLMQTGARDFRTGQDFSHAVYFDEGVDIHHIFPKAWCEAKNIKRSLHDTVVKKTLLFYKTNGMIGGSALSAYITKIMTEKAVSSKEEQDAILASYDIRPELISADDFINFYTARREALLQLIEATMGKTAFAARSEPKPEGPMARPGIAA